jgi:hypothetical protein
VELRSLPEFADALATSAGAPPSVFPTPALPSATGPAKTSGMAIASVVLGVFGFLGVTALAGLILGIVALSKIGGSQGRQKGKGVAIAGIVLSSLMLLIAPVAILAGMLLPALAQAKSRAQTINCVNNMKQITIGVRLYASDNSDKFPQATNWCDAIISTVGSPRVFQCPQNPGLRSAYAYNLKLSGLEEGKADPQTVMFFESNLGWNGAGGPEAAVSRHRGRGGASSVVVGFVDGSVQEVPLTRLRTLRWDP